MFRITGCQRGEFVCRFIGILFWTSFLVALGLTLRGR